MIKKKNNPIKASIAENPSQQAIEMVIDHYQSGRFEVAEELAKSLEKSGKIEKKDKKEVSEELTEILKKNSDKLSQDKDLIELIKNIKIPIGRS